jgi:MFS family permease
VLLNEGSATCRCPAGFAITAVGFAWIGFVDGSWRYLAFVLPLVAVGMGLSNGPATSASTACVSADHFGSASGVSNIARHGGAAVATALAASIYGSVIADRTAEGKSPVDAPSSGLATASWAMAIFSLAGVVMALVMGRSRVAQGTLADSGAAAAARTHTLPTSATPTA